VKPLFYDRQYVGYQVRFVSARGEPRGVVHVTGAASRFLPFQDAIDRRDDHVAEDHFKRARQAAALDAPPESGGFAGGLAATATQTAHYATARRNHSFDDHGVMGQ
jgi:hypothetical protein